MGDGLSGSKMEEVTAVYKKKNCLTRGSTTCTAKYWEDDQIREDHIGGKGQMHKRVWWGKVRETGGMKDLGIYKIILK